MTQHRARSPAAPLCRLCSAHHLTDKVNQVLEHRLAGCAQARQQAAELRVEVCSEYIVKVFAAKDAIEALDATLSRSTKQC